MLLDIIRKEKVGYELSFCFQTENRVTNSEQTLSQKEGKMTS